MNWQKGMDGDAAGSSGQIKPGQSVAVFIGPEGGFEEAEVELAKEAGFQAITLGRRILRTETAGMTVLSILMYAAGRKLKSWKEIEILEAYLDNSATTWCTEHVRDVVVKTMMEDYGNPSSKHTKGMEAEKYLRESREIIAKTLKVNEKEIFFTSGGTESDNWALIGTAMANRRAGKHIITTAIEHAAVLQPMLYLQEQGFEVTFLPVDRDGTDQSRGSERGPSGGYDSGFHHVCEQ